MKKFLILGFALLMLSARLPAQNRITATLSAAAADCATTNVCLALPITPGVGGATFTVSSNTSGNTLQFEATANGGTTWVALNVTPSNSTTAATSTTSTGTWQANVAAYTSIRIRMSTLSGGTSTVTLSTSTASARAGGGGGGSGTIGGTIAATQVAFGSAADTIAGDAGLTYVAASPNQQFLLGCTPQSVDMSEACGISAIGGTVTGNSTFGDLYGWQNNTNITINSPNTTSTKYIGMESSFDGEGSGSFTDSATGQIAVLGSSTYGGDGSNPTGSAALLVGVEGIAQNQSNAGTVTTMIGLLAGGSRNDHTASNNYGVYGGDQHGIGSVLNASLYAPDQGAGAKDYALYLAGGKAHSAGPIDTSAAGGLSTGTGPAVSITGAPVTGGSGTTTVPLVYLDSGTAPTTWSTAGTAFGINLPSGFTGNVVDFHLNGAASFFGITNGGTITANGSLTTGGSITGAAGGTIGFNGRTKMFSVADGVVDFANTAITGLTRLSLGPDTTPFPALCPITGTVPYLAIDAAAACTTGSFIKTAQTLQVITADVTCGTGGTIDPCTAFSTITGLTKALPTIATNWTFDCNLIVSQTTSAVADQIGVQTATNASTNLAADGVAYTAAGVSTAAAFTGASSTTAQSIVTFTPGGTGTKLPVHVHGTIEGTSASGTTFNLQALTGSAGDLLTIYRGSSCWLY